MANPQHVEVVKLGAKSIKTWRVQNPDVTLNLFDADLSQTDLRGANLIDVDLSGADLSGADLSGAYLSGGRLNEAKLVGARLNRARLITSRLSRADLTEANLTKANLRHANLAMANFSRANLTGAKLRGADLRGADLSGANLNFAKFINDDFQDVNFADAVCGWTVIADGDLSAAKFLETVRHRGPSTIGIDTLANSRGNIPDMFLQGCGCSPWQVLHAKLYDPALHSDQVRTLLERISEERAMKLSYSGGVFIAHERKDEAFASRLRQRFRQEGIACWRNPNEFAEGPLQRGLAQQQLTRSFRSRDVVVLVLSGVSTGSDWVEQELDTARRIERTNQRNVLFPVALDDSWKSRMTDTSWKAKLEDLLWRQSKTQLVVDFRNWEADDFERDFQLLLSGIALEDSATAQTV